jgi:glycosyltransferase involved in cell wall biosynthesis
MSLRIGVDARQLAGPTIGAGRALAAVLDEWRKSGANGHEIFVYAPRPILGRFEPPFHLRVGSGVSRLIGGSAWLQSELPLMAARDRLDAFWATLDIAPLPLARKVPTLLLIHDFGYFRIPDQLPPYTRLVYRALFRPSIRAAARIVCTTGAVRDDAVAAGKAADAVHVVSHGVELKRFTASPDRAASDPLGIPPGYFLFVGHLRPNKNLERTLEAYRRFLSRHGDGPDFVLAGGRTQTDAGILRLIESEDLRRKVRYVGFVPDDALSALYGSALAFVSPSLYEGFGLPYLEAMAAGLPVVAPEIPTVREVCGDAAFYVDPNDVNSISRGFEAMTSDPALRAGFASLGARRAGKFGWAAAAQELLRLIELTAGRANR